MLRRKRPISLLAALVVTTSAAMFATPASAGTYAVTACTSNSAHKTPGWSHDATSGPYFYVSENCWTFGEYSRFDLMATPGGSAVGQTFTAPADTWISKASLNQDATARSPGAYDSVLATLEDNSHRTVATVVGNNTSSSLASTTYTLPATTPHAVQIRTEMGCQSTVSSCPYLYNNAYGNEYYLHGATITLADESMPEFASVTGAGWQSEPADGVNQIDYSVTDKGSGVAAVRLFVDGIEVAANPTQCTASALVPCPLSASGSLALDTTRLSEGAHTASLVVADWASNATPQATEQLTFTVRRAPLLSDTTPVTTTDPSWNGGGAPAVGDQLSGNGGSWSGDSNTYAYQWMRCDSLGTNCLAIDGATALTYTATSADIGHTLVFCVTASNSGGSATSCSAPTPVVVATHPTSTSDGGGDALPADAGGTATPASSLTYAINRGRANGSPASDRVVLTALANSRSLSQRVKFGKRVPISGRLLGPSGTPIAGAVLAVQTQTALPGASLADSSQVVTDRDGRFRYVAPAGPSRVVRFGYRSYSADTAFADTTDVHLLVTAGVTMQAKPRKVHNRHATVFTGRLLGRPLPRRGVVIDLQVFFRGQWRTFATPRTKRGGVYRFKYRFMAGAATWKFRARVRADSSYPYALGYCRKPIKVRVLP